MFTMTTANKTVDEISTLKFVGNIIPFSWFHHIRTEQSPDLIAIIILAEIVYWYRGKEDRDKYTGQFLGFKKRFKADKLQRSYQQFADLFHLSRQQVERAVKRLKKMGLITTETRMLAGVGKTLFLEPNSQAIFKINFSHLSTDPHITGNISPHITDDISLISPVIHHTKTTTTELTTEIKNNNNRQNTQLSPTKKNDEISEVEKNAIRRKITAMKKAGEITDKGKSIDQLCEEVEVHVANRPKNKLVSSRHAINAAAKLMKQGKWGTPARLVRQRDEEYQKSKRRMIQNEMSSKSPLKTQMNKLYAQI